MEQAAVGWMATEAAVAEDEGTVPKEVVTVVVHMDSLAAVEMMVTQRQVDRTALEDLEGLAREALVMVAVVAMQLVVAPATAN